MTLAELKAFDVPAAWARLSLKTQAVIGEAVIAWMAGSLIAEDSTGAFSHDDRRQAETLAHEAQDALEECLATHVPALNWIDD